MGQGCWYGFLDLLTGSIPVKIIAPQVFSFLLIYGVLGSFFERKEQRITKWASLIPAAATPEDFRTDDWLKVRQICWVWHGKKVMDELHASFKLLRLGLPVGAAAGFVVAAILSLQGLQGSVCQSGLTSTWLALIGSYGWIGACILWAFWVKYRFYRLVFEIDENL
jgi:hypothetical protein